MIELEPVEVRKATLEEISANYAFLREGCKAIKEVNAQGPMAITPAGSWTAQHIFALLLQGRVELWGAWRGDVLRGFGITQMVQCPYTGVVNSACVFLAYKDPNEKSDAYERVARYIAQVMKERGCDYLEAYTRREDLAKSEQFGWKPAFSVIRLELWD